MLYKKLKRLLITVLTTIIITSCFFGYIHYKNYLRQNKTIEYKMDLTEYKIKQVLNTNKLQSLEMEFTISIDDAEYDKSKFKFLDNLSKTLTTRKINVTQNYKATFSLDLGKAKFQNNLDGTYTITLNTNDIEVNVYPTDEAKIKDTYSLIGYYYNAQDTARVLNQMNELAKSKVDTQENKNITVNNTINNLIKLFGDVGIDTNKIIFKES